MEVMPALGTGCPSHGQSFEGRFEALILIFHIMKGQL
jgi:hypothetical protein